MTVLPVYVVSRVIRAAYPENSINLWLLELEEIVRLSTVPCRLCCSSRTLEKASSQFCKLKRLSWRAASNKGDG